MPTIGDVAVGVTADATGLADGLTRDINGRLRDAKGRFAKAGTDLGRTTSKGFGSTFGTRLVSDAKTVGRGFTRALGGAMTAGAAAVGGAVATGIGTALTKGFSRLVAIDTAQAKLEGLGNSTEDVAKIMKNATTAVKGTMFGLDDAATAAASAVAAGIKPGKELTKTLTLIGSTATVAGADYNEIASIFNRVAASGRLQGEELAQLGDRGIPILSMLSKSMGVSADEVRKLASEGKIGFKEFQAALEPLGDAAKIAGTSFKAGWANVLAGLGRIGANILKPVFDQLTGAEGLFQRVIKGLEPLEESAKGIGEALGGAFSGALDVIGSVAEKIKPIWDSLGSGGQTAAVVAGLSGAFLGLGQALGPLLGPFAQLIPTLGSLRGAFSILAGPIGLIAGLLIAAFTNSEPFRESLKELGTTLLGVGKDLSGSLGPAISELLPALQQAFGQVGEAVGGVLAAILPLIGSLVQDLVPVFQQVIEAVLPLVTEILTSLGPALEGLTQIVQFLVPVVQTVFQTIAQVISGAVTVVIGVLDVVIGLLSGDWSRAFEGAKAIVQGVFKIVVAAITSGINLIRNVFKNLTGKELPSVSQAFTVAKDLAVKAWQLLVNSVKSVNDRIVSTVRGAWNAVVNAVRTVNSTIVNTVRNAWNLIVNSVRTVNNRIVSTVRGAWGSVVSAVTGFMSSVTNAIRGGWNRAVAAGASGVSRVLSSVRSLPGKIRGAVSGFGSILYSAGRNIIQGLVNGIRSMVGAVRDAVSGAMSAARNLLPFSPAKEGPFSGKGWTLYSGQAIMEDLARGLEKAGPLVVQATRNVVGDTAKPLTQVVPTVLPGTSPSTRTVTSTINNAPTVQQNYYGPTTSGGRLREIDWTLRYATRARTYESAGMATA